MQSIGEDQKAGMRLGERFALSPALRAAAWLAFAGVLLARFYAAGPRLIRAGQNPLEIIRADAGITRLETAFWVVFPVGIVLIGLGLPSGWSAGIRRKIAAGVGAVVLSGAAAVYALQPFAGEAASRAALGLLGATVTLLAGWTLGRALFARWHIDWPDAAERFLFELMLGCGFLSLALLGLAFAGGYTPAVTRALTGVLAGVGVAWLAARMARGGLKPTLPAFILTPPAERWWLAAASAAGLVALLGALAPETEFDALWYHMWLPRVWLEHGSPVDLISEYVSLYPLGWELLYGAAMTWGGAVAAKLFNLVALLLMAWLTWRMTRRLAPGASPWLAAAVLLTTPTVLWEGATAYNDLGLAVYALLSVSALAHYLERRSTAWLLLAGLALGMALAVKHLGLFLLVLLPAETLLILWRRERRVGPSLWPAALLAGISLLIPLPWYLRSWMSAGNPFFPELYGIFGAFPPVRWDAVTENMLAGFKAHFGGPRTHVGLLALPWNMTVRAWQYGGTLGVLYLLLIPGLLLAQRRNHAVLALAGLVAGYLALWASPLSSFQMRFLIPLAPLLAVLAAEGYARLRELLAGTFGQTGAAALQIGVVIILLLNLPPWVVLQESGRTGWQGWLTHVTRSLPLRVVVGAESEQDYLIRKVPSYQGWQYIDRNLPAGSLVLTFMEGDHYYSHRPRLGADTVVARPATWGAAAGQESQAREALARLGVTHLLFDKRNLENAAVQALALTQPGFIQACLTLEFEDRFSRFYRLDCEQAAP